MEPIEAIIFFRLSFSIQAIVFFRLTFTVAFHNYDDLSFFKVSIMPVKYEVKYFLFGKI